MHTDVVVVKVSLPFSCNSLSWFIVPLSLSLSLKKFFSFIQKILENFKDVKNNQLISPILTTLLYHSFNHDTELMVFKKLFA